MEHTLDEVTQESEQVPVVKARPANAFWYVIHTYSGYENKVRDDLLKRAVSMGMEEHIFDVLVPTEDEIEFDKSGRRKTVQRRVYPGYVLVEMVMSDRSWYVVRNTPGVMGFVSPCEGNTGKPVPLLPEEVTKIKQLMGLEAPTKVTIQLEVGQRVRITQGPLQNYEGVVSEVDVVREKVKVMVTMFGRDTATEVDLGNVEKLV